MQEPDPQARIESIASYTAKLKGEDHPPVSDLLVDLAAWVPAGLLSLFATSKNAYVNTLMTSVAGSSDTLYSMGAEMEAMYTHLPLLQGIGLSTALMSYNGVVYWAFNGDYDMLPDIAVIKQGVAESFEQLQQQLEIDRRPAKRKAARKGGARRTT